MSSPAASAARAAGVASNTSSAAPAAAVAPEVRAAWERCAAQLGAPADPPPRVRRFGETAETTNRILPLVLSGEKTITSTTPWVYERDPAQRPIEGGYSVVLDAGGRPVAVLRTIGTKTVAFDAVTGEDSRYEGRPVRPLAAWREVHVRYFDRVLKPLGRQWAPDMPVTLERFEVVCRA